MTITPITAAVGRENASYAATEALARAVDVSPGCLDGIAAGILRRPWASESEALDLGRLILGQYYLGGGIRPDVLALLAADNEHWDRPPEDRWPSDPDGVVNEVLRSELAEPDPVRQSLKDHVELVRDWLESAEAYRVAVGGLSADDAFEHFREMLA